MVSQSVSALIIGPPGRLRNSLRVLLRANGGIEHVEQADDARSGQQSIAARPRWSSWTPAWGMATPGGCTSV
jgi:hypothetical protein